MDGAILQVEQIAVGALKPSPAAIITAWLSNRQPVLLALDAPLGWPTDLGSSLSRHHAGDVITPSPERLFSRYTDTEIKRRLGKRPLEVGANLIARTAHAALNLLDDLRGRTGLEIPLAWDPQASEGIVAIEVYPAATRLARQCSDAPGSLEGLESEIRLPTSPLLGTSADARDAVVCALSGSDFLSGASVPPSDVMRAKKEGWIWARRTEV